MGWILRGALATLGLAGVVYAADQVTTASDDVARMITNQRIQAGTRVNPGAPADPEHQAERLSPDQMIDLAGKYDGESKAAVEHGESARVTAYRSRDLIRMTCIDDKLVQMRHVMGAVAPKLLAFPGEQGNELLMRQHFLVFQLSRNRMLELAAEVDACLGDVLDSYVGRIKEEIPATDSVSDPTRPAVPGQDIERPGEASPYR